MNDQHNWFMNQSERFHSPILQRTFIVSHSDLHRRNKTCSSEEIWVFKESWTEMKRSFGYFTLPISWSFDQTEGSSIKFPTRNVTSAIENFNGNLQLVVAEKCDCTFKGNSFSPKLLGFFGLSHLYCQYWKRSFFKKSLQLKGATFDRSLHWKNRICYFSQILVSVSR